MGGGAAEAAAVLRGGGHDGCGEDGSSGSDKGVTHSMRIRRWL